MTRVPRPNSTINPASDGTREIPMTPPAASEAGESEGHEALINPGEAVGPAGPARPGVEAVRVPSRNTGTAQAATPVTAAPAGSADLAAADQLFRAQNFEESGRIYAALAARNLLPAERRPHWAYCRFKSVVRRINAGPRSAQEWDAIEAEVRSIQRLTPGNWYGEYLINKVAEARRSRRRRPGTSDNVVVRGSSPDDPAPALQPPAQAPATLDDRAGPPRPPPRRPRPRRPRPPATSP